MLSEREIGLKQITDPGTPATPKEAVLHLTGRKWQRWCSRIKELGGTLPDSALRVKALEKMTKASLLSHPDIGFRINLTKAALQIDATPDDGKVEQLHAQLLSELEMISHRTAKDSDRAKESGNQGNPRVRGVEQQDQAPTPPKKGNPNPKVNPKSQQARVPNTAEGDQPQKPRCTFYLGPYGCKKGADCTYTHDWNAIPIPERSQRCKTCGARTQDARLNNPKGSPEVPQPPPPPGRAAELKSMLADAASILRQTMPVPAVETTRSEGTSSRQPGTANGAGTGATPQANSVTPGTPVSIEMLAAQLEGLRAMARGFEAKACRVDEILSGECEISRVPP